MLFTSRRSFLWQATLAGLTVAGCSSGRPRVVLYCAQDRDFAEKILASFQEESGLSLAIKFDTEANKSVSLYREIVAEKARPRCDVFWNNEILSTLRLHKQGLLASHNSPVAVDYPDWAKDPKGTWYAFASRARVLLVNTEVLKRDGLEAPRSLLELAEPRWKDRVVMGKPQFGTTATHMACLFEVLGPTEARDFLRRLKQNGVQLAPGNKPAAEWVGAGRTPGGHKVAIALTDTDDALIEIRAGSPVQMIFPDRAGSPGRLGTLYIPNTLCLPRGSPNPEGARLLVDYLLAPAVEKQLAEGPSGQIPLNPRVQAKLPAEIRRPEQVTPMRVDWTHAAELWDESQKFINQLFATG